MKIWSVCLQSTSQIGLQQQDESLLRDSSWELLFIAGLDILASTVDINKSLVSMNINQNINIMKQCRSHQRFQVVKRQAWISNQIDFSAPKGPTATCGSRAVSSSFPTTYALFANNYRLLGGCMLHIKYVVSRTNCYVGLCENVGLHSIC